MPDEYISSIPEDAVETVVGQYPTGEKRRADYFVDDELVGFRYFFQSGEIEWEVPYKGEQRHSKEYRWTAPGIMLSTETYIDGKSHGIAKQWDDQGELIGTYTMDYGTGIDFWWGGCDHIYLCEVHYMKDGLPHGYEWWLNGDQKSIGDERHWFEGQYHGIERSWNLKGRLRRGYPNYYVHGKQVSKRQYIKATETDPILPKFSEKDNEPYRDFPDEVKANFR